MTQQSGRRMNLGAFVHETGQHVAAWRHPGGRAGWNLVTSNNESEAFNHGREHHAAQADRYDRAAEFAKVVNGLWDSWDDDAFVRNKDSRVYYNPAKMHVLNHKGKHFAVRGPLNVARSPQGRPMLVQAGASDTGRDLAARYAELVFTAQTTFEQAKEFYSDVIARVTRFGHSRRDVKIMPGLYPVVGCTEAEAKQKFDFLQSLIHPSVGLAVLEHTIGVLNLSQYPLHGPVSEMGDTDGPLSRQRLLLEAARRDNLTLWELCLLNAGPRCHLLAIGTPTQVADVMEHWFRNGAADGFNVMPAWLPGYGDPGTAAAGTFPDRV